MIFLCFSVKDRLPLINNFYHFLTNFGLDIWYDRRNIYLGDNRKIANINNGAENPTVKYAIIFYSENFRKGNICIEEFDILVNRYKRSEVFLFPVFIGEVPNSLDARFGICKRLFFKQISDESNFNALALHIIAKITSDELICKKYKTIEDIEINFDKENLLYKLIIEYQNIQKSNFNMRITLLFSIYITISYGRNTNYFHHKTMDYIYHQNCLDILINEKGNCKSWKIL